MRTGFHSKPPNGAQINFAHHLARDLVFHVGLLEGSGLPQRYLNRNNLPQPTLTGSVSYAGGPLGVGLKCTGNSGNNELRYSGSSVSFAPNQTQGTVFVLTTATFSPTDSAEHGVFVFGNGTAFPNGNTLEIVKWSDNNIYAGWAAGADHRISLSASGLWIAGARLAWAITWNKNAAKTERLFLNGRELGSRSSALTTGNSANGGSINVIRIGGTDGSSLNAAYGWDGWIYSFSMWDRELTAEEIRDLTVDPYSFYQPVSPVRYYTRPYPLTKFTGRIGRAVIGHSQIGHSESTGSSATLYAQLLTAIMGSFAGRLIKRTAHKISASMGSFAGSLAGMLTGLILKSFTAGMGSWSGNIRKQTGKRSTGSMGSFAGSVRKRTGKLLIAGRATFSAVLRKRTSKRLTAHPPTWTAIIRKRTARHFAVRMNNFIVILRRSLSVMTVIQSSARITARTVAVAAMQVRKPFDAAISLAQKYLASIDK